MRRYFSKTVVVALFAALVLMGTLMAVNSMTRYVTLVVDGQEQVIKTYKQTVSEFLSENGIAVGDKDKIDRNEEDILVKEDKIEIIRAVPVTLHADGAVQEFMTPESTVADFLLAENVTLGEIDKLSVPKDTAVEAGMTFTIVRVTKEIVTESMALDFATAEKKDATLLKGEKKTVQEGAAGEKVLTKERTYEDGVLVSETLAGEEVTVQPVDKVIAVGTKVEPPKVVAKAPAPQPAAKAPAPAPAKEVAKAPVPAPQVVAKAPAPAPSPAPAPAPSRGTLPSGGSYSKAYNVEATAYAGDTMTASGAVPVRNPDGWSTIAVDRSIIPLGTKVYVENYGYAIAQDVGGAIKGNKIDVFMNSEAEALRWGRRTVMIYILE